MKRHERTFETYKRNHKGTDFVDAEKAKIHKEKNQTLALEKKANNLVKKALLQANDECIMDEVEAVHHEAMKVSGNRKSHKNRLKELQKNDDFI
jgi:hypothetical protein